MMKLLANRVFIIISVLIMIIIPIVLTIFNYNNINTSFFAYTFIDLYNVIITILIGIGITIVFTSKFSNTSMRLGIIIANIDNLHEVYKNIISKADKMRTKKFEDDAKSFFIKLFKIASIELANIKNYIKECDCNDKVIGEINFQLINLHLSFKALITDEPFQEGYIFSDRINDQAISKYYEIKFTVQKMKLLLYKV